MQKLVVVVVAVSLGCSKGPAPPEARIEQDKYGKVDLSVTTSFRAKMRVRDQSCEDSSCRFAFLATALPPGKSTITVELDDKGTVTKLEVPFERQPLVAALTFGPFDEKGDVRCRGDLCEEGAFKTEGGKLLARLIAPLGSTIDFAGTKITLGPERLAEKYPLPYEASIDLEPLAGEVQLDVITQDNPWKEYVDFPVVVKVGDSTKQYSLGLPITTFRGAVMTLAAKIDNGPLAFGSTGDAKPATSALFVEAGRRMKFVGEPAKLREVDLIAVPKLSERSIGTCGPYERLGTAPRVADDAEVTLYDRRTGKVMATKAFPAKVGACPTSWYGVGDKVGDQVLGAKITDAVHERASIDAIGAWMKSHLK